MKTKILVLTVIMNCLAVVSFSQQKRLSFTGTVQAGLLEGEKGSAMQFGATAGVKLNSWIASLGSGLDYYDVRSIPVFLNVQKNIFNRDKTPFVYLGGGHHFLWLPKTYNDWSWWGNTENKGGLYYHAGIGYQLPVMKKAGWFFTAGFSEKQHSAETSSAYPCLVGPCPEYKEKISHRLRRLSVTTGLRF